MEYYFRAVLCHLCVGAQDAETALEDYQKLYPAFQRTEHYKLLEVGKLKYFAHKLKKTLSLFSIMKP
jgi:hypothetical protein